MGIPIELRKMLWANTSCFIVFIYIGIFVNLYIWEKNHEIFQVAWFNLIMFLIWPAAYTAAAKLLTYGSIRLSLGVSSIFGFITFLQLSLLKIENQFIWLTLIALPTGIMWGFFSATQNLCVSRFGKGKDFATFFSLSNTIAQILNMTVPIVSAFVIRWFGFKGSFLLMLVFISLMLAVSFYLPRYSFKLESGTNWRDLFIPSRVFRFNGTRWLIPSSAAAGFFIQFQALFALLYTFTVAQDKLVIALLNSLYTCFTLLALFFYQRVKLDETKWIYVSVILILIGFLVVLTQLPPLLILSNVLTTVGVFYFNTSLSSKQFHMISRHAGMDPSGLLIWRECCTCFGRMAMLVCILQVKDFHSILFYVLMSLAMVSLLMILFFEKKMMAAMSTLHNQ